MKNISREITITRDSIISDIQKEFASFYPFLKFEFYQSDTSFFAKRHKVNSDNSIIRMLNLPGSVQVNVDEERTIAEVEADVQKLLGLSIQIFRKSGNVWNVISITNSWTLQSQNMAGEFISTEMQKAL